MFEWQHTLSELIFLHGDISDDLSGSLDILCGWIFLRTENIFIKCGHKKVYCRVSDNTTVTFLKVESTSNTFKDISCLSL